MANETKTTWKNLAGEKKCVSKMVSNDPYVFVAHAMCIFYGRKVEATRFDETRHGAISQAKTAVLRKV